MNSLFPPVIIRFLTYVLSSLLMMLPAWAAGLVILNTAQGTVSLSLATAGGLIAAAVVGNAGIAARWGVKIDPAAVAGLLARLFTYGAAPAIAALPAGVAGLVSLDPASQMITLSYGGLATMAALAIGGSAPVFTKWGRK
jgi:hypothetical protein